MEQVIWLSAVGAFLALDSAIFGQFMVSQPLVVGSLLGGLLGDWPMGLLAGALVQMLWLGVIAVGAYVPPDHTLTGGIAAALTVMLAHGGGYAFGPSLMLALALSIPAGVLAGQLDVGVRHWVNNRLARRAEALTEQGVYPPLGWFHLGALVPSFLKGWLIYALWLGPGAWLAKAVMAQLPARAVAGLALAYWALPAVGFAVVVEMFTRERFPVWVVLLFAVTGLALWLRPLEAWIWLAMGLTAGVALAWRKNNP